MSLDTAQKIALGFYFLCVTGFYSVLFLRTLNLVDKEFSSSAFQFLLAIGGYAVFGKPANVFAESRRDRYRNEERRERLKEMLKKVLGVVFSFSGFLLSLFLMFVFGKREGKHQRDLEESEREKRILRRGRKIEEEVKNEFEKAKTPEEILRIYRSRTGSR